MPCLWSEVAVRAYRALSLNEAGSAAILEGNDVCNPQRAWGSEGKPAFLPEEVDNAPLSIVPPVAQTRLIRKTISTTIKTRTRTPVRVT